MNVKRKDTYITQAELTRFRAGYRIGDVIRLDTLKAADQEGSQKVVIRDAKVIGKCPQFVIVRLPSGVIDSVRWVELMMRRRTGKHE